MVTVVLLSLAVLVAGATLAYTISRSGDGIGFIIAATIGLVGLLASVAMGPLLAGAYLLLLVVGLVCLLAGVRPRSYALFSIACCALALLLPTAAMMHDWRDARRKYPFESLSKRLSYERVKRTKAPIDQPSLAAILEDGNTIPTDPAVDRFADLESTIDSVTSRNRRRTLELAHASQVEQFVHSAGFGVGRMMRPSPGWAQYRDDRVFLAQPDLAIPHAESSGIPDRASRELAPDPEQVSRTNLEILHRSAFVDFSNPDGFGYVRDLEHAAGFVPHAFRDVPHLPRDSNAQADAGSWTMRRIELISLIKHDPPGVYVSEHLPRMDELREAAVRPLDDFETRAVDKLRGTDDLVLEKAVDRIRMVGSLRAAKQCLECHTVRRGDLLGAFSYDFVRTPPIQAPARVRKPIADIL